MSEKKLVVMLIKAQPLREDVTEEMKKERHLYSLEKARQGMIDGVKTIMITNSSEGIDWNASDYAKLASKYHYTLYILDKLTTEKGRLIKV